MKYYSQKLPKKGRINSAHLDTTVQEKGLEHTLGISSNYSDSHLHNELNCLKTLLEKVNQRMSRLEESVKSSKRYNIKV